MTNHILSRIVFSYTAAAFGPTGNGAIRSADPENSTLESNAKSSGEPFMALPRYRHSKFSKMTQLFTFSHKTLKPRQAFLF